MRWYVLIALPVLLISSVSVRAQAPATAEAPAATESPADTEATDATTVPAAAAESGAPAKAAPEVLRVEKDSEGKPLALQTAIVRYRGKKGTEFADKVVDLVGVVHIGQAEYYQDLDKRLSKYDVVLYELVAPDGTRIKPEDLEQRRSLLASMQSGMKDMLNLEYQLEKIDYQAENFRHADMSPDEFVEDLARRGDSLGKMFARMMGAGLASSAASGGDAGILLAMFSNDRSKRLKQAMARQLIDIELVTAGMDDANGDNTLIKGRNAKAFSILREELASGKGKVAVFYGAGHLLDMAERLETDFQMEPRRTTWLDAWDLTRN